MNLKSEYNQSKVPVKEIAIGTVCSLTIMLMMTVIGTSMMQYEKLAENQLGIFAFVTQLLSAFIGCIVSSVIGKERRLLICVINALIYMLILGSVTIFLFEGSFDRLAPSFLAVALGAFSAFLSGNMMRKKNKKFQFPKISR